MVFLKFIKIYICATIIINFMSSNNCFAQQYKPVHHYTTQTGLPSNLIYELQQDAIGNLWICTNSGISRFDGKYFRNYTFRDGLPSDDVVACRVDAYGRLWLNCFGHKPTYYENDAFNTIPTNKKLGVENLNYILCNTVDNKVEYGIGTPIIQLIFAKDKSYTSKVKIKNNISDTSYMDNFIFSARNFNNDSIQLFIKNNNTITDTLKVKIGYPYRDRNGLYGITENILKEISINKQFKFEQAQYAASAGIIKPCFSEKYIIIVDKAAMVFIYNRNTKKLIDTLQAPKGANCAFVDNYNQLWIGTKNDGLYCFAKNEISTYLTDVNNNQFISVFANNNGAIFAGNAFAQVHQIHSGLHTQTNYPFTGRGGNIKCFLPQHNELYIVEDNAVIVNSTKENIKIKNYNDFNQFKSGVAINDSILFIGSVPGAYYLNTRTKNAVSINTKDVVRIYACAINKQGWVYFRYNDKIHKVHYPDTVEQVLPITFNENEIPVSLTCTSDDLLWIATNENKIYIAKNDKIIDTISAEIGLLQNITHLTNADKKIVVSSKNGIAIIDYTNTDKLKYQIHFISQQDGLPSAVVNQCCIANDSIYCGTENGIAVLHKNFVSKKYNIYPSLQSLRIDNILMPLQKEYALKAGVHSVKIQIGGVDVSGHLYGMQYALNDTLHWNNLEGNQLSLILQGNETKLYIRSIDIQNNIGIATLACIFDVAIPFYNTIWFAILSTLCLASGIFIYLYQRKIAKQKIIFDQQKALEQQQQKITADLHDDVGATLSSLQLNSTIAKRYLQKDIIKTNDVLSIIETQAKELAEKLSDIIWSMKPSSEAFGNFSDRIKTYASQTLENSNIDYVLKIDAGIDVFIKSVLIKKDLIFVTKEAINNAVKYSKAQCVTINATVNNNNIEIEIKDNGIGFDATNTNGNGLGNMRNRLAEIGGQINIESKLQQGTSIKIILPTTRFRG
jgi:signal transduction histidine kinase/ligand-binding sensor domain-containing protein